jgi:cell division septation protein DedD
VTSETLVRSQLLTALPPLLEKATVVVLTPASADMSWAADAAWSIARAVARHGRRVALVDLSLTERALEPTRGPGTEPAEGIVDAFSSDASLQRVVQKGDVPGLFYIGVGSEPTDSVDIWGHQRWDRIARGFAEENALLLLFVPAEAWTRLRPSPDRVVTLGTLDDTRISSESARWSGEGVPVTHLIPDPPEPEIPDAPVALWSSHIAKHRRSRSRLRRTVAIAVGVGALVAAGYLLTRTGQRSAPGGEEATPDTTAPQPAAAPVTPQPTAAPPPTPPVAGDDSLYYSVQVASFKTRARALDHAAGYESQGWPTTLTPVQLGLQGVWYRVMVGVFASPADAESALRQFYASGLLERPNGTILRTPHVLTVSSYADAVAAAAQAAGLREAEIPAYIVMSSGAHRVMVGAFENPEQAILMDSILADAGLSATLTSREGRRS